MSSVDLERASRLIVLTSIALAAVTHAWLASWQPWLAPVALAAFIMTFVLARVSLEAVLVAVLGTAFIAPALLALLFGVSDYHLMLVWLAALAGPLFARATTQWILPRPWKLPLVAWALVIAITWPLVAGREIDFSLTAARTVGSTTGLFMGPPPMAAALVTIVALAQMLGIVWIDLLWARFGRAALPRFTRVVVLPLIGGASLGAVAGIYQRLVDLTWMNPPLWSNLHRAGGLMYDANTFATGAAVLAPTAIVAAWSLGRGMWIATAAYVVLAAGAWAGASRTALLVLAIGSIGLLIGVLKRQGVWQPRMGRIAALIGTAVVILVVAVMPRDFDSGNPLKRAFDRLPRLEVAEIRRFVVDDLWVRFGYGSAAAEMIAEHPVSGIGVGAFAVLAPDYIFRERGRHFSPDNAQNWWRHQLAELGIAGAAPSLWFSALMLLMILRADAGSAPADVATALRAILLGVGVASLVGVPTQHPAMWLVFATLLFWLASVARPDWTPTPDRDARGWWLALFALALVVAGGLALSAQQDLRVAHRALRTGIPYAHGVSPSEGLSEYGEFRWIAAEAVTVIPVPNQWLQLTMWAPYTDLDERPQTVHARIDGREAFSHTFRSRDAVSYFVEFTVGTTWALIELSAAREQVPGRAVQLATRWLRELPEGVPPTHVIR